MKDNVDEFLVAYKAYEMVCRAKGKEVKDIEDELGENNPKMQKIRICRQLRNFCVHNEHNDFIQIHKGMIKFLKEEIKLSKQKPKKINASNKNAKSSVSKKKNVKINNKSNKKSTIKKKRK